MLNIRALRFSRIFGVLSGLSVKEERGIPGAFAGCFSLIFVLYVIDSDIGF